MTALGRLIQRAAERLEARRRARDIEAAHIDANQKCPWCGNRGVTLEAGIFQTERDPKLPHRPMIKIVCRTCGGRWYEKTVADPKIFLKM